MLNHKWASQKSWSSEEWLEIQHEMVTGWVEENVDGWGFGIKRVRRGRWGWPIARSFLVKSNFSSPSSCSRQEKCMLLSSSDIQSRNCHSDIFCNCGLMTAVSQGHGLMSIIRAMMIGAIVCYRVSRSFRISEMSPEKRRIWGIYC
jgi:hypothetical protein